MALLDSILQHGILSAVILTLYMLAIMRSISPRVWGFSDYPKEITEIVEPQTKRERQIGAILGIPFIMIFLGIPIVSTILLEVQYGGTIPLFDAFLNIFGLMMFLNFADLVILDTLIIGTITPHWVIIPGTEHLKETEYKNFRAFHARGHIWGTIGMTILSFIVAVIIVIV